MKGASAAVATWKSCDVCQTLRLPGQNQCSICSLTPCKATNNIAHALCRALLGPDQRQVYLVHHHAGSLPWLCASSASSLHTQPSQQVTAPWLLLAPAATSGMTRLMIEGMTAWAHDGIENDDNDTFQAQPCVGSSTGTCVFYWC